MRLPSRLLPLAVILAACAHDGPRHAKPGARETEVALGVWVEDAPDLPKEEALAGCGVWAAKGVRCASAADALQAQVRLHAVASDCKPEKDGGIILALAYRGGRIEIMTPCFRHPDGKIDRHQLRAIIGHEIGHQAGIWQHVPYGCAGKDVLHHPGGRFVCGEAIMNPYYNERIDFATEIDGLAFDLRDRDAAVIIDRQQPLPSPGDAPDCVYRTPPRRSRTTWPAR